MTGGGGGAPVLLLGPLLRYTDATAATIWVETDRACTVGILGREAATFEVAGHHYALVVLEELGAGSAVEYRVALDGTVAWPEPGSAFPPSVLRTHDPGRPSRLLFGSCRVTGEADHGPDALAACAEGLRLTPPGGWPDALLLIGDQVYADNPGPGTRQFIERRRGPGASGTASVPPLEEIADFTEYCVLYREAWSDPAVRWLFSVVSTSMIFDDHDFHDDWNTSAAWCRDFRAMPWWRARIEGAYMSYWIYQHLGNLSPAELDKDEVWRQVREGGDAAAVLADMAVRADQRDGGVRWSFLRTFGAVLVVVIDSRSRRVLDGTRRMADEAEWRWVTESVRGEWDHVVLATSLPLLLPRGIHALEAWDEAVCGGAWGGRAARAGERLRRAVDLEHWSAFRASFADFERLLSCLATGAHGTPPASVTIIAGDVHHSFLAPVNLRAGPAARSAVYEAVCSPIRNTLPRSWRTMHRLASSRAGALSAGAVARLAGVRGPRIRWRITAGPWFDNMLAALHFDGPAARIRFDRAVQDCDGTPSLAPVHETKLS